VKLRTVCLVFLALITGAAPLQAAEQPRIGVVLSGGGALGSAHVGVLKVLEELHIPIHCIAGTSMGAIVGGLYAAGYSAEELEEILQTTDWKDLLDDRPNRKMVPFRRKVDDLTFLSRLEMGFNDGKLSFPPALIQGQKLGALLQTLTVHTVGMESFDDLPIPFRAVATDLETGAEVVMNHGDLARALRASMAVPGVFAPSIIDDRLLVDGGLVNNLPVDLARKMGADVVIAVDVGDPLLTRDKLDSLTRVAGQVVRMTIRRNVDRQMADADIVLFPDVSDYSSSDFHNAHEMVPIGEQVARASTAELAEYAMDPTEYDTLRSRIERREISDATIVSVQVSLASRADPEFVFSRVRTRPGDPLDVDAIVRDLDNLYAVGDYEKVSFYLTKAENGYVLNIEAHEKSWGPDTMRFGVNMTADLEGQSDFNLLANHTMTRLNALGGEAKLQAQIGQENRLMAELYQPLDSSGRIFVSPTVNLLNTRLDIHSDDASFDAVDVTAISGGLDLGWNLRRWGELRVGVSRTSGRAHPNNDDLDAVSFDQAGFTGRLILDQLDDPNFPQNGWIASASYFRASPTLGSDERFKSFEAGVLGAVSRGRHTFFGSLEYSGALDSDLPSQYEYPLGGLFHLSGYPTDSLSGRYVGFGLVSYYFEVADFGTSFVSEIYAGLSLEAGNVWQRRSNVSARDLVTAGAMYVGVDSYFGPVYLAYGRAEDRHDAWYLFVGRSF